MLRLVAVSWSACQGRLEALRRVHVLQAAAEGGCATAQRAAREAFPATRAPAHEVPCCEDGCWADDNCQSGKQEQAVLQASAHGRVGFWLLVCWLGCGTVHLTTGGRYKAACKQLTCVSPSTSLLQSQVRKPCQTLQHSST